jgi:hypothetical protein
MIEIMPDASRRLVRVMMSGFLQPEDVQRFTADKEAAVEAMGLRTREFLLLIDTAGCTIQSQEVVAAFIDAVLNTRFQSKRLAVVRHDNLTRMQTRRILSVRDDAMLFETVEEAEEWLFAPDVARGRAA